MKVIIGKYISHVSSYTLARKIVFWKDDFLFNDNPDPLIQKIENFLEKLPGFKFFCNVLNNRKRKVKVQIHNYDSWSADNTLALIIVPLLEKIKEQKNSAPRVDDNDVPVKLKSTSAKPLAQEEKDQGYPDDNHFKRWDYVLDEMLWSFKQFTVDDWKQQYYTGEVDFDFIPHESGKFSTMKNGPNHTFKVDNEGIKKHQARIDNGLRLFAKYYESLWT